MVEAPNGQSEQHEFHYGDAQADDQSASLHRGIVPKHSQTENDGGEDASQRHHKSNENDGNEGQRLIP